jgi:Tfp pilus assembly protein PilN
MFRIDLLKGRGTPAKFGFEVVIITLVAILVPAIITVAMLSSYVNGTVTILVQKHKILSYQKKINELSGAVGFLKSLEKDKSDIAHCIVEVASNVDRYTQWSPILATIVENMPDSVVLTRLGVEQRSIKKKVPKKEDPKVKIEKNVPVKVLNMSFRAVSTRSCDKEIRDFRERLSYSQVLGPNIEYITVSQGFETLGGRDMISYEIACALKPKL